MLNINQLNNMLHCLSVVACASYMTISDAMMVMDSGRHADLLRQISLSFVSSSTS